MPTKAGEVGDIFLVNIGDVYSIIEFNGSDWKFIEVNQQEPKYLYVIDKNKTMILFQNKLWNANKYFICVHCHKISMMSLKIGKDTLDCCVHCFFKINHDNPNKNEYDIPPMTIGKYIQKFSNRHNPNECVDSERCFLCDHKKNKLLIDIKDKQLIYPNKLIDLLKMNPVRIEIKI